MKTIGEEYAIALYELAMEAKLEEETANELNAIEKILSENSDYVILLDNPTLELETRLKLAGDAFTHASEYTKSLIMILVKERKFKHFAKVAKAFGEIYDEEHKIVRAEAITAFELDFDRLEKIRKKLEKMTEKTVILTNKIDKSVLGGVLIKYDGKELDGSLSSGLKTISNMISQANI